MIARIHLSDRGTGSLDDVPILTSLVRGAHGFWADLRFVIDTGAGRCAMPISLAVREGIAFRRTEANRRRATGLVGSRDVFRDSLTLMMFGEAFTWPCDFLDGSNAEDGVLGRDGLLTAFKVCLDLPWRRLSRRLPWYRRLLTPFARTFDPQRPL